MTFKNQKPKATPATNKTADLQTTATTDNQHQSDLERLATRVNELEAHHLKLEQALSLASHRAECAKWGITPPPGFDDMPPGERYQWLEQTRPKFASVPPHDGVKVHQRMMAELVAPLQAEVANASKAVSTAREEFWSARNVHELGHVDELIAGLDEQIKVQAKMVKASASNVQRLNGDLTRLTLEQTDHAAAVLLNDDALAQAVADGSPIDRGELVNSEAVSASISKLITVTRQAVRKAQEAATKDRQALNELEAEMSRLQRVKTRARIVSGLDALLKSLQAEGIHQREFVSVLESAHTLGLDRILVEVA